MNAILALSGSAMNEFSNGMSTTAHNIANINTPNFKSLDTNYTTGAHGIGVQSYTPGLITGGSTYYVPTSETDMYDPETYISDLFESDQTLFTVNSNQGSEAEKAFLMNKVSNDVSLEKETANMILTEKAFEANTKSFVTADVLYQSLLHNEERAIDAADPTRGFVLGDIFFDNLLSFTV